MKKQIIRAITLCLVLLVSVPMLFSCNMGKNKDENSETNKTDVDDIVITTGTGDSSENDERTKYMPERIDYEGAAFKIVHDLQSKKQYITHVDGAAMAADAINIAFAKRDALLESYFNIDVQVTDIDKSYGVKDELEINSMTQTDFADAIYSVAGSIMSMAVSNGYVTDLNTLEGLNLEASYYDQRIQKEYLVEGKLFCIEGDFQVHDEMRTHVIGINKSIYNELHYDDTYGSPYELVRDKEWTLDLMLQMAKGTSDFASLGSGMTMNSQWGIISESPFPYVVYLGTGNKIVEVNEGSLVCSLADDTKYGRTVDIISDCVEKIFENPEILIADKSEGVLTSNYWSEAQRMFANGQALFRTSTLSDFTQYRDMEDEFGILPVPLYVEGQQEYYSWCSGMAHTPLLVPRTITGHEERTANVIEAMSFFSKYMSGSNLSVLDAFYEKMTYAKLCRSAEDYEMLELIFANKTFDIDYTYNLSGTGWKITTFADATDYSVPSFLESYRVKMISTDPETNPMLKLLNSMWNNYS
ncbi:MAG: hypothetical protein IJ011_01810 [Clostridia bacterium]|nr:hypothetical protein [Clostridia bacterium]